MVLGVLVFVVVVVCFVGGCFGGERVLFWRVVVFVVLSGFCLVVF